MKYLLLILKFIGYIACIVLIFFLFNYLSLNIFYNINKRNYEDAFSIYGNNDNYVPQGLVYSDKYNVVLQTSYNKKHLVSKLYVIDFSTGYLLKELDLKEIDGSDNANHVGGIATDDNTVWISNDYEINEYSLEEIVNTKLSYIKSKNNTKLLNRGDFCTYNNGILWVGDFYLYPFYKVKDNKPLLLGYDLNKEVDYRKPDYKMVLPKMVQGLTFDDIGRFIFTRSYTFLINSDLVIYDNLLNNYSNEVVFNDSNKISNYKIPPMAEGLFYKDGDLYILFESSSNVYSLAFPKIRKVMKLKILKIDA